MEDAAKGAREVTMTRGKRALACICGLLWLLSTAGCDCCSDSGGGVAGPSWVVRGSGVVATEHLAVGGFGGVSVSGASRLILERAGADSVSVTAEDNILPHLTADLVEGRLLLGLRPGVSISPTREIVYRVTGRDVCDIVLSGASRAEAAGLDCPTLVASLSGAAFISAAGRAEHQQVHASGASQYRAGELVSRTAAIDLSGASLGTVRSRERLVVHASGSSILEYFGSPLVSATTTGGSLVRRIGD